MMAATLEGANAYFEGTLKEETWAASGAEKQQASLKDAGRVFEAMALVGIPRRHLDYATYEQAFCLLNMPEDAQDQLANINMGLTSVTVGKHSETYSGASTVTGLVDGVFICPDALKWISAYMSKRRVRTGRLVWPEGRRCP